MGIEDAPQIVNRQASQEENLYGKIVDSEEQAKNLYIEHARRLGFDVRTGQKRYSKNTLRQINFLCSKQGFKEDDDILEEKKFNRLETRTGCKASIRFTSEDDKWKVTHFNNEHNHEFAKPEERQFLKINRHMTDAQGAVVKNMVDAGIGTSKSYNYLAKEVGGSENVGFTKRDCYNFVNEQKLIMIEAGDAQSLLDLFKRKQAEDPLFFYASQVDQENRMTNFFWRDGKSRCDYDCFGDVVVFDTTYRTNRYNMICAPFVGINHHWSNVLFGCAFLLDETTTSFEWLFKTFLESMGNRQPKTIFTDQCQAMGKAIKMVFPETQHRLCKWHISKNAAQHLAQYFANPEFKNQFNKCLYWCETETELQSSWDEMIEKFKDYKLEDNKWLKKLYNIREKWCSAFSPNTFSARVQASQRSESTNNVFHQMSTKTMSLTNFMSHYDDAAKQMRYIELEEDYRCNQGLPKVGYNSGILRQAANAYTRKIFKLFKDEFTASLTVKLQEIGNYGTDRTFQLIDEGKSRVHVVQFNSFDHMVSCSCKLFESKGILCRHALRVINVNNITEIPTQYIMKRWTKNAKKGMESYNHSEASETSDESSIILRRNDLIRLAYGILSKCAETTDDTRIAKQKLTELEKLVEKELENSDLARDVRKNHIEIEEETTNMDQVEKPVLDPPYVRPKGISNDRLKGCLEKTKRKAASSIVPKRNSKLGNKKLKEPTTAAPPNATPNSSLDASHHPTWQSSSFPLPSTLMVSSVSNQVPRAPPNATPNSSLNASKNSTWQSSSFPLLSKLMVSSVDNQVSRAPPNATPNSSLDASHDPPLPYSPSPLPNTHMVSNIDNQNSSSSLSFPNPNFSFRRMLQNTDYFSHLNQEWTSSSAHHTWGQYPLSQGSFSPHSMQDLEKK